MTQPVPPVPPARFTTELGAPPLPPDPDNMAENPLLSVGTITTIVGVLLSLTVLFGLKLNDETKLLILGATTTLAPIIVAAIGRRKVWSPASVNKLLAAQRR